MKKARFVTNAACIAALYVVLSYLAYCFGLSSGAVQLRLSEALTLLPYYTASAVPGVTIGCLITNLITGGNVWDVVFGALATLIGAVGTHLLRKKSVYLACIPPVVANTVIVPLVLRAAYGEGTPLPLLAAGVFAGEFISCALMGTALCLALKKRATYIFGK